ncbi:MAG: hypothetical protein HLUCCO02_08485 [Idiomarinaceae bacterium HL-53]|nr:MAG: hypothetical protein HLUCCO02_08485 [Idiomarinaceae bacterium HL-53]
MVFFIIRDIDTTANSVLVFKLIGCMKAFFTLDQKDSGFIKF